MEKYLKEFKKKTIDNFSGYIIKQKNISYLELTIAEFEYYLILYSKTLYSKFSMREIKFIQETIKDSYYEQDLPF